jgi:hypothetical protein
MAMIVEEDGRNADYVTVPSGVTALRRDAGKMFRVKEWPARRAEKWAWGMVFALKGSSGQIPDDVARLGMVGVGIRLLNTVLGAPVQYAEIEPYMDELIDECVTIVRDPTNRDKATGGYIASAHNESDFLEVGTLQWLRSEVIRVHTNFSVIDALSALLSAARSGPQASWTTPTSPP